MLYPVELLVQMVGKAGLEPAWLGPPTDFKSVVYTNSTTHPKWYEQKDSNLRPARCKRDALPLSYARFILFSQFIEI